MVLTNMGIALARIAPARGPLLAMLILAPVANAQVASSAPDTAVAVNAQPSALPLPFRGGPLITGYNLWYGSALEVRTASHSEPFEGSAFSAIGVQFSRSLFTHKGFHYAWLVEVLPALMATVSAPRSQIPSPTHNWDAYSNPERLARYMVHDAYGIGLAPLGAEVSRPLGANTSALFTTTAGGAFFNSVVPYGKATQANFTASGSLALSWQPARRFGVAAGYSLHHLSNASMGDANPGMNSHMLFVRVAKSRF